LKPPRGSGGGGGGAAQARGERLRTLWSGHGLPDGWCLVRYEQFWWFLGATIWSLENPMRRKEGDDG